MGRGGGSNLRSKGVLAAVALFALAQGVWLASEFSRDRERHAERHATQMREPVPAALRQETESAGLYLSFVRSQAEVVLKERIRERVDEAVAIASSIHQQAQGKVSPAMLRTLVREGLRTPRFFDGRGYYFIDDLDGNCILLPTAPEREGTSLMENRDDTGRYIMRELIRAAQQPGGSGFVRYRWFAPHSAERMEEKIAYVRMFPQLGWLIGTGDYTSMVEEDLKADALKRLRAVSFAGDGSLVVVDNNHVVRLFRDAPGIEGQAVESLPEGPERRAVEALMSAVRGGNDTARYAWSSASTGREETRLAWVSRPATWGWIVAAVSTAPAESLAMDNDEDVYLLWHYGLPGVFLVLALFAAAAIVLRQEDEGAGGETGDSHVH